MYGGLWGNPMAPTHPLPKKKSQTGNISPVAPNQAAASAVCSGPSGQTLDLMS